MVENSKGSPRTNGASCDVNTVNNSLIREVMGLKLPHPRYERPLELHRPRVCAALLLLIGRIFFLFSVPFCQNGGHLLFDYLEDFSADIENMMSCLFDGD